MNCCKVYYFQCMCDHLDLFSTFLNNSRYICRLTIAQDRTLATQGIAKDVRFLFKAWAHNYLAYQWYKRKWINVVAGIFLEDRQPSEDEDRIVEEIQSAGKNQWYMLHVMVSWCLTRFHDFASIYKLKCLHNSVKQRDYSFLFWSFAGMATSQIASSAFTLGTAAVLPFYTFMVVAPQAEFVSAVIDFKQLFFSIEYFDLHILIMLSKVWLVSSCCSCKYFVIFCTEHCSRFALRFIFSVQTKKLAASSIPYIVLGVLYAYLLYLSWTPETIRLMFASKYWLPEVCLCV